MKKILIALCFFCASISFAETEMQPVSPSNEAVNPMQPASDSLESPSTDTVSPGNTVSSTPSASTSSTVMTPPNTEAIEITDLMKIVPKTEHQEDAKLHYTIDLNYPQIESNTLSPQAEEFNKLIKHQVDAEVSQFKKYVAADMPHMQSLSEDLKHNSLRMDYDVDVVRPKGKSLISIRLSNEGFQAGRAHPYHTHKVLNFDLTTGKVVTLSELFKSKSNYLNVISKFANKKLTEKLEDKWMINEGTKPIEKNYQIWNLENDGILITFDEYQVAPYVYGAQEIEIPYSELKSILSPKSPIYICAIESGQCEASKDTAEASTEA